MHPRPAPALVVALLLVMGIARAASAQQVTPFLPPGQPSAQPQPQVSPAQSSLAESGLQSTGVSLARIRQLLREQPPTQVSLQVQSALRLQYHVEVKGRMPFLLNIMTDFTIDKRSAVAYGGMTHAEFLQVVAPPWRKW
jgi:hypothetical protein